MSPWPRAPSVSFYPPTSRAWLRGALPLARTRRRKSRRSITSPPSRMRSPPCAAGLGLNDSRRSSTRPACRWRSKPTMLSSPGTRDLTHRRTTRLSTGGCATQRRRAKVPWTVEVLWLPSSEKWHGNSPTKVPSSTRSLSRTLHVRTCVMPNQYFDLTDDVYISDRWDLGRPIDEQGQKMEDWLFTKGEPATIEGRPRIPLRGGDGKALDFSEAGIGVPLVSARVAAVFAELAPKDVQLIPVDVEAHAEQFYILVCTRLVKCIDHQASHHLPYWKPEDGRPEKTGRYRAVHGMRIDPAKVGDAKVFRPWGWDVVLIISEDIKQALERMGAMGAKFEEVTGPSTISADERTKNRNIRELLETAATARETAWRTLGSLDKEVIMPIAQSGSPAGA